MASILKLLLFVIVIGSGTKYLGHCHPVSDSDWVLKVTHYAIYAMVRESKLPPGVGQAESVLKKLCELHSICFDFLDTEITHCLRQTIKRIMNPALKAIGSGGKQARKCIEKMENTVYALKLGGLKRKMEHELESERKRRKKAESDAKEIKQVAKAHKKSVKRAKTTIQRLIARRSNHRNTKVKKGYGRTWLNKKKKDLNDTVQFARNLLTNEGVAVKSMMVQDLYGNQVEFPDFENGDNHDVSSSVDRMLYVKDTYMRAYQEMSLEAD